MIKEALTIGYEAGLEDAWECARKIVEMGEYDRKWNVFTKCDDGEYPFVKYTASEAMAKLKEYEEKHTEEKTDKSCESCRFADLQEYEFPCSTCSASHTFKWEARKGASE